MAGLVKGEESAVPPEPSEEAPPVARFFSRRLKLQSPTEALQPETPPPPPTPRRRRPTLSALSGFLSFLMILAVAGLFGALWGAHRLQEPGTLTADKVLYIAPGTDFPDIIAMLEQENVIDNPLVLNIALVLEGNRSKVKAGEYLFKQNASMREVMDTLVSGKQILHSVTLPEGLTSEQIVDRLRGNDLLLGDIREIPPEGSLLPETYKVARGMPRADLLRRMQEDQKKLVEQIWSRRSSDLNLHSPYELVTLASIVEKETGKADERPRVAAVFLNRLQKRMRLQSDPTIVYGLAGGKGTLGRALDHDDVEKPSPYNTYLIDGLPPGPITNPGRAALEAVANPSRTQDLYFVADGTGGHVFAETLEQHQRNVTHWRQIEKDAKDKAGGDIDKYVPLPPTGRPDQRGEIDDSSVYGALPAAFGGAEADTQAPVLGIGSAAATIAGVGPMMPIAAAVATVPPARQSSRSRSGADSSRSLAMGPSLDDLGISVRGVGSARAAANLLDGPVDQGDAADAQVDPSVIPVASTGEADQKADSENAGLAADANDSSQDKVADNRTRKPQEGQKGPHPAAFDASEGTSLDPLLNKTYDLNYPKTVPSGADLK
jgi:UPF0755 protein